MKESKQIWHYTIVNYLPSILLNGIKVATANVPRGETPSVWFSTNQEWEETANKSYVLCGMIFNGDKEQTRIRGGGLIRIEVSPETAPMGWRQFVKTSNITNKNAKKLVEWALYKGSNHNDWRISCEEVSNDKFLSVEYFNSDKQGWIDISEVLNYDFIEICKKNINITGIDLVQTVIKRSQIIA